MPTGDAVRQAILHDQPHGQADDAVRVPGLGRRQVGHVGVERLAALGATVHRVVEQNVAGTPGDEISDIVDRALILASAATAFAAAWTGAALVESAASHQLGLGKILDPCDSLRGIRHVFTWRHDDALRGMFGKARKLAETAKVVTGEWIIDATVSASLGFRDQNAPSFDCVILRQLIRRQPSYAWKRGCNSSFKRSRSIPTMRSSPNCGVLQRNSAVSD
jgi:hypothetical protein